MACKVFLINSYIIKAGFDYVTVNQENLTSQNTIDLKVDQLASYILSPRDSIMVPHFKSDIDSLKKVIIEGMVRRPGSTNHTFNYDLLKRIDITFEMWHHN